MEQVRKDEAAAAAQLHHESTQPTPTPAVRAESRIPVAASPPAANKMKTIKKHSKTAAKPSVRPAVGNIEWDTVPVSSTPAERITELSTLQLEDVTSPKEHESSEPVVILSPGDDYSGEIDEVILVQTPGDDADIDEDDEYGGVDSGFSPQRQRIETTTTTVTTLIQQQQQQQLPTLTFSTTDDDMPTISLSLHSDSEDGADAQAADDEYAVAQPLQRNASNSTTHSSSAASSSQQNPPHHSAVVAAQSLTFGSSSGSDVALHEPGAEPSDDDEPGGSRDTSGV